MVSQGIVKRFPYTIGELRIELERAVTACHGLFDGVDMHIWSAARVLLASAAEVIEVDPALPFGSGDDHPTIHILVVTPPAPDRALQVVVMYPLALPTRALGIEGDLDPLEKIIVDQRLVATGVLGSLVADVPDVIAVPQHGLKLGTGYRTAREPARSGAKAPAGELLGQTVKRPVAGRVQLEGQSNERRSLRVDGNASDLSSFEVISDVQVAERRPSKSATATGLLAHLVADVGTVFGGTELVEGRQDSVEKLTGRCVVDALGCRYECDTELPQAHEHESIVYPIAVHARQLVDDYIVDVTFSSDALKHRLESGTLVHACRAAARLDVLVDDVGTQLVGFAQTGHALCGNRDSFGVVVCVHL